jgi:hypothetical protein
VQGLQEEGMGWGGEAKRRTIVYDYLLNVGILKKRTGTHKIKLTFV